MSVALDASPGAVRRLLWEQGSLVPLDAPVVKALTWAHPRTQANSSIRRAVAHRQRQRPLEDPFPIPHDPKEKDRLMVITHTCDIVKSGDDFPQVEVARVFETTTPAIVTEAQNFGSARYFRLNPVAEECAVVLDFGWRGFVDKGFLLEYAPDNTFIQGWDDERRAIFAHWLGRRYSRPALSDDDVAAISDPIRHRWQRLVAEEPETARALSDEYAEFRYRRETNGRLTVYILSAAETPDALLGLELTGVLTEALERYRGEVNFPTDRRSYHSFTMADQLTTQQVDLEWASIDEGGAAGALPGA